LVFEPISCAAFDLSGRYEVINVFVHIVLDKSGSRPGTIDKDYIEEKVINTLNNYSMKKVLFLTALFTSMLIGFAACSDDDEVYSNVGIPVFYSDVTGELFKTDGVYFFRATDSENEHLLKELKDSVFPISIGSLQDNSIDIEKYVGYVSMEITDSFQDSIWVKSIASIEANDRSRFITP
jgi:hypothetical protein